MSKSGIFISDLKVNVRLRDFFLDFLACLVPGLIFLIGVTFLVGGLLSVFTYAFWINLHFNLASVKDYIIGIINSFSFHLWFSFTVTFLAYFAGHLLYRQTPKRPDYASFLRIRRKVIGTKNDWVIPRGKGVTSDEIQFPYSNLKNYLKRRGFRYLAALISWGVSPGKKEVQRSKTFINKMKIRISLFYPELTLNIIRNEAHIRLFSSMWYASKYVIKVAYICNIAVTFLFLIVLYNSFSQLIGPKVSALEFQTVKNWYIASIFALIISCSVLFSGFILKRKAKQLMQKWKNKQKELDNSETGEEDKKKSLEEIREEEDKSESEAGIAAGKIDLYYFILSYCPIISAIFLAFGSLSLAFSGIQSGILLRLIFWYLAIQIFLLLGAIFAKHRIEETVHYQRVREVFYVLETLHLTGLSNSKKFPSLYHHHIAAGREIITAGGV